MRPISVETPGNPTLQVHPDIFTGHIPVSYPPLIDHTARLGDIGIIVDTVSNVVVPPSLKQLSFPPETSMTNDVTSCYPIGLCALWSLLFQSRLSLKRSPRGR